MPVVQRFPGCRIRVNAKDHPPPHFHVLLNDEREAWVRIDTMEIIHGRVVPREIADALKWAKENRDALATLFKELQQ